MSSRFFAETKSKPKARSNPSPTAAPAPQPVLSRHRPRLDFVPFSFGEVPLFPPNQQRAPEPGSQHASEPLPWPMQAKLVIGAAHDPLEREADRLAECVMRMPDPVIAGSSSAGDMLSRKCASCAEEENKKIEEQRLSRKRSLAVEALDGASAPPLVQEVLRSPGQSLDASTRAFFEPRFGRDFRHVRLHRDAPAAQSARAVGAVAYTVGPHVVFADEHFSPHTASGSRLLAHELGHVVQQARHTVAVDRLQRDPAPAVNKWDRIAKEVFGRADYDEYLAKDLSTGSFFGQSVPTIHSDLDAALKKVETDLKKTQGAAYQAPKVDSTLRKRGGMHGWGMAVDFDVLINPYVLNEYGEKDLDKELLVAYDHIAQFMLGDPQTVLRKLTRGRAAFGGKVADVYDALRRESDGMKRYFAMKGNDAAITAYLANEWLANHQGQTPPAVPAVKAQMQDDYEVLGGATASGAKRPTGGKGDRPFAPSSGGGRGDPATGFLNLGKEFVLAMTDAGLAWGAIDIAGEPGDIQHFDTRLSGTGARVYGLLQTYK